jgi:hypothetical protein
VVYACDPEKPADVDFSVRVGGMDAEEDPNAAKSKDLLGIAEKLGASTDGNGTLKRGLRVLLRKFGFLEIDNDNSKVRLTMNSDVKDTRVISVDPDMVDIEWAGNSMKVDKDGMVFSFLNGQFMAFKKGKFMLKADNIGFAGPVSMWNVAEALEFKADDGFPDKDKPAFTRQLAPHEGIYFKQSVYFGDKGEPALLESFVDNRYAIDMQSLFNHAHTVSGSSTGPPLPPTMLAMYQAGTVDTVRALWLSLISVGDQA